MTQESLTEKLAKHLMRPVDKGTQARARLHLLDWLGCVAGARGSEVAKLALHDFQDDAVRKSMWLGNVMEMDDVHRVATLHPGPVIWPCLLGSGPTSMNDSLDNAVRGYEACVAVGSTFDSEHYRYYHNTTTAGYFGAVAATFDYAPGSKGKEQLVSAMGLAGSVAGGLWQMRNENGHAKQWHIMHAIETGTNAAICSWDGVVGPRYILEGPQGLYAATCKEPKPMQFPGQWRIHEVSFKPWGACRHAHPAIDAALELKSKLGTLDGDILVESYADAITFCDRPDPTNPAEAKFSLQHAVAVVAAKGEPELADFEADAIAEFAELRARVSVKEASGITARYPEHYGARVSRGNESVELVDTLGDPERPMSEEKIIGKARALISWGGLPDKEADRAVDLALQGDDVEAVDAMLGDWLT